jgi:hypothetical protein
MNKPVHACRACQRPPRGARSLRPAAAAVALLAGWLPGTGPARAAEPLRPRVAEVEPVEREPGPAQLPPLAEVSLPEIQVAPPETLTAGPGWLDASRGWLEAGIGGLVVGFDRFFGDPNYLALEQPRSFFRLRGDVRYREGQGFVAGGSVLADVRLPALTRWLSRFSLSVAGGGVGGEPPAGEKAPPVLPTLTGEGGALELRYDAWRWYRGVLDIAAGVRFGWPPPAYVRLRVLEEIQAARWLLLRLTPAVFWEMGPGFGETTRVNVDVGLSPTTLWRTEAVQLLKQFGRGLEWGVETGVQQMIMPGTAVYPAFSVSGATADPGGVEVYRAFARLRQELHRKWIYAELEPEVRWPLDATGVRRPHPGATVRLELQLATVGSIPGLP